MGVMSHLQLGRWTSTFSSPQSVEDDAVGWMAFKDWLIDCGEEGLGEVVDEVIGGYHPLCGEVVWSDGSIRRDTWWWFDGKDHSSMKSNLVGEFYPLLPDADYTGEGIAGWSGKGKCFANYTFWLEAIVALAWAVRAKNSKINPVAVS